MTIPSDYYNILAQIESSGNPYAKAATSSASGLYQFTKSTFQNLGFDFNNVFDTRLQQLAIEKLTTQNANALAKAGVPVTNQSLYAAHFLGAGTAVDVLGTDPSTPIANVVNSNVIAANPFLSGMTVGDFQNWLNKKVTVGQSSTGSSSSPSILDQALAGAFKGLTDLFHLDTAVQTTDTVDTTAKNAKSILDWIKAFFSINTGERLIAVFVGIGLVIIAVIFLTGSEKIVVETGKAALAA